MMEFGDDVIGMVREAGQTPAEAQIDTGERLEAALEDGLDIHL